jgi:glycosyltransferase involved in cell wall biosynthesis
MKKKVLVISYYWPPAGGISPHRCIKFVKYLRKYNWEPIVATVDNPSYFFIDETNFKDIPEGIEIIKTKIWEPHNLFKGFAGFKSKDRFPDVFLEESKPSLVVKIGIWIRGNLFIPDARKFWINRGVKHISEYLKHTPVDAILSMGTPHSTHMIAYKLKRKFNIPWLADFQDPWTQADYYQRLMLNPVSRKIHEAMERRIFKFADKVTICSESWKKDLESIGAKDVGVILWGYDKEDFVNIDTKPSQKFSISHFGRLTPDRNPHTLWKVLSDISAANPQFKKDLEIELVGFNSYSIFNSIKEFNLQDNLKKEEHIKRNNALERMQGSRVLLLILNDAQNVNGRIPGKLFEYLASKRPILVIGPEESDAAKIVTKATAGSACSFKDYNKTFAIISEMYNQFIANELNIDKCNLEPFSSERITGELAGYLNVIDEK